MFIFYKKVHYFKNVTTLISTYGITHYFIAPHIISGKMDDTVDVQYLSLLDTNMFLFSKIAKVNTLK